jgi:serine/threonine-protein kinase
MSPEQLRSTSNVDTRTDIWALGVVLYELITGQVPFEAESIAEVCALVLGAPPRPIEELHRDVPPGLAAVIARCLQKDPDQRFATVAELAEALDPFVPTGTAKAGERIRRVQTQSAMPAALSSSQNLFASPARKTEGSWGTDAMLQLGPKPSLRLWIALTAVVGVLGIAALVFGLRARAAAAPAHADAPAPAAATSVGQPPSLPTEPPPPITDPAASAPGAPSTVTAPAESATVPGPLATAVPHARPHALPGPAARPPRPHATVPNRDKMLENR